MKNGRLLAISIAVATLVLVVVGTVWPVAAAVAFAGGGKGDLLVSASTPEAAANDLGTEIRLHDWSKAYSSLSNKAEFTQDQFLHDLTGYALSLRTYATLDGFEVQPLHQSANDAEMKIKFHWSTVVGAFEDTRDVHIVR